MTAYHKREVTPLLFQALNDMPVVVLTGMRQSGKSTLLQREPALRKRRYISLDDFEMLEAAEKDPEALMAGEEPLTIDEIQKAPQMLQVIKRAVDKKRSPGRFILSGSANLSLLHGVSESLAGRAFYLTLSPMNRREINGLTDNEPFLFQFIKTGRLPKTQPVKPVRNDEILRGGMPSVCLREIKNPLIWFQGYEQTYLERDVRAVSQVADIISFRNLLHLTALRTGQMLNQSELGRDAKLNSTTIGRYLSLFELSFLMKRLPPYFSNKSKRLIKSPKLYLSDSGLAAYLAGLYELKTAGNLLGGACFETYVCENLISLFSSKWPQVRVCFWNVQGRHEVDFILEIGQKLLAVEIKQGSRWNDKDLSGLRAFLEITPHCQAAVLAYNGTEAISLGKRLWAIPLAMLLS